MFAKVHSAATFGVDAICVDIECHIEGKLPSFTIVGLPDNAVKESRERVLAALKNSGFEFPPKKVTVNLAPADMKKEGSSFDLPIALGLLVGIGKLQLTKKTLCLGELSLDGFIRPVKGVLPIAIEAQKNGFEELIIPFKNVSEASVVEGISVIGVSDMNETVRHISGEAVLPSSKPKTKSTSTFSYASLDFSDVKGQQHVKRAMEIAATGGHNILLIGPPGSGKTMLARRLPSILPELSTNEALETTKIYSIAGQLKQSGLMHERPFRSPHHTVSDIALIGGGRGVPTPGDVSLAHNGVLFLDELPEFKKSVLEVMRQPLEDREVTISRASASLTFPAHFMLVAAMNPCPCGYGTDPKRECACNLNDVQRYLHKISGPLLDRIDIHIEVPSVEIDQMGRKESSESSVQIRHRVNHGRMLQEHRFASLKQIHSNAGMGTKEIEQFCGLDLKSEKLLKRAMDQLGLSARAYHRILKVSRTIADLEGAESIDSSHIAEAIQYRSLDKQFGFIS